MQSGKNEQNYWPGFVDALSNVVLTLVFVIVIFVFALVMSADKVAKTAQEITKAKLEQQQNPSNNVAALEKENTELRQKLADVEAQLEKTHTADQKGGGAATLAASNDAQNKEVDINVTEKPEQKTAQKSIGIQVNGDKIVIAYPLAVADLDDKSVATLEHVLDDFKGRLGKGKITIRSIGGNEPFSAAQRYAYYRAVRVRNYLIAKGIADGSAISSLIVPPVATGGDRVEIIFGQ